MNNVNERLILRGYQKLNVSKLVFSVDDAAEMAPNRDVDAVAIPSRRPMNGAAARQDEVVVTWNASCWTDWQLPVLVVLFAGLGVLAVIFVVIALYCLQNYVTRKEIERHLPGYYS